VLFKCLYDQQRIHINRHSLSLPVESVQHRNALQATLLASRAICSSLSSELTANPQAIRWPGYSDMLAESTLILMYGRKLGTRLSNERCVHNIPGLMQGRALSSLQKAAQALDILTEVWDRIRPVTLLVREHIRNLDPDAQSGTTQVRCPWIAEGCSSSQC
jgi:hypothetical protein